MTRQFLTALFGGALLLTLLPVTADAQGRHDRRGGRDWENLGCQTVGFRTDRDVIRVGRREGRFSRIRFEARNNAVHLMDVNVVYGNGRRDDIRVRRQLRPRDRSPSYDLKGRGRFIRQIEFVYRARPSFRGRAEVCAYGLQ